MSAAGAGTPAPQPVATLAAPAALLALGCLVMLIYWSTLRSMVDVWARSDTFAHGVLILPLVAWLVLRRRAALAASRPGVCWAALVPLALLVAMWVLAALVQADVVRQFAMVAMIPTLVLLVAGPGVLRAAAFPLLFTLLAVPMGEFLIPPMMDLTADGSVRLLRASGVPVYQDGWLISIPAGNFQVADACSGVRYLIGAVTSGLLFAWLFFKSMRKRIYFMAFVIILTVMANVLRAYIIILLAHLSDMRLAAGVDHFIYGWLLFAVLLLVIFAVGLRHADPRAAATPGQPIFSAVVARQPGRFLTALTLGTGLMLGGPVAFARLDGSVTLKAPAVNVPYQIAAAQLVARNGAPRWLRPDLGWRVESLTYRGATPFEVSIFQGGDGSGGADLALLREQLDAAVATLIDDRPVAIEVAGGVLQLRQMRLRTGARDLAIAYWFTVGAERTANPITAKLLEIGTIIRGQHKKPALIAVALDTKGLDQPASVLRDIVAELAASIAACAEPSPAASRRCDSGYRAVG